MKESPKEKYIILANEVKLASSIIGLTKYEERAFTLVCFCTYGVNKKINNILYHKEKASLRQVDFTKIGIPQSQVRKTLESLASKGIVVWEERNDTLWINEEHLASPVIDLIEPWKVIGKNINEFKEEYSKLFNKELQINKSAKAHNIPSESQKSQPRDKVDNNLETTDEIDKTLLKYLKEQNSINTPGGFLNSLKKKYGSTYEKHKKKLLRITLPEWKETLDYYNEKDGGKL
ncbi:MAG: hypothetical protein PHW75_01595 [Patescibacteria group bacterium]|nr:hypothetical protein [Patescibacteria group bacterium]